MSRLYMPLGNLSGIFHARGQRSPFHCDTASNETILRAIPAVAGTKHDASARSRVISTSQLRDFELL
jgi:hypothetical protein